MISVVIIPVLNRYDLLERCIESIPATVDEVLVIDNGDTLDEIAESRLNYNAPLVRVLRMPSNLGVAASWNLGIKLYPFAAGWLLLNSDAWFVDDAFGRFEAHVATDRVVQAGAPPWCCTWVGRDVVERVGLFCELFYPAYMEDIDYEERCDALNVPVIQVDAHVGHDNSSTIRSSADLSHENDRTHRLNTLTYADRWASLTSAGVPREQEWSLGVRCRNAWGAS